MFQQWLVVRICIVDTQLSRKVTAVDGVSKHVTNSSLYFCVSSNARINVISKIDIMGFKPLTFLSNGRYNSR